MITKSNHVAVVFHSGCGPARKQAETAARRRAGRALAEAA
jgi:hypothetical protein